MRRLFIAAVVAGTIAAAPTHAAVANDAPSGGAPVAHVTCKNATIGGKRKCIARGQFCARAHQRDYRRYGFSCSKRDANGRYHLT